MEGDLFLDCILLLSLFGRCWMFFETLIKISSLKCGSQQMGKPDISLVTLIWSFFSTVNVTKFG